MQILKQDLLNIYDYIKVLKSSIIIVLPGYIYGSDDNVSYLRSISYDSNYSFIITMSDLNSLVKEASDPLSFKEEYYIMDTSPFNLFVLKIKQNIEAISSIVSNIVPISINNLDMNDEFTNAVSSPASAGAVKCIINNKLIYLYSGFISVNKNDKVDLKIYNINNGTSLYNFSVYKKKNIAINYYNYYINI